MSSAPTSVRAQPGWTGLLIALGIALALELAALGHLLERADFGDSSLPTAFVMFDVGLALVIIRRALQRRRWRFLAAAVSSEGVVVDRVRASPGNASSIEVEYRDGDGRTHRIRSSCTASNAPHVGELVRVFYDPSDPTTARLELDWTTRSQILGGFALICVGFGVVRVLVEIVR
jgi:hypothetical protein